MNINDKINKVESDHQAFRRKVADYELDYQDMKRDAKRLYEDITDFIISFCHNNNQELPIHELRQLEENRDNFEKRISRFETRLSQTYQEENKLYNKSMESLEEEKKKV